MTMKKGVRPPQILKIDANSVMLGKLHADEHVVGYGGVGGVSRGYHRIDTRNMDDTQLVALLRSRGDDDGVWVAAPSSPAAVQKREMIKINVLPSQPPAKGVEEAKGADEEKEFAEAEVQDRRERVTLLVPSWVQLDDARFAAEVSVVAVGERAAAAGLRSGDVVVEVDGTDIGGNAAELTRLIMAGTETSDAAPTGSRQVVVKRAERSS